MKKLLFSAILAFALIAAQMGTVFAQDSTTSITGIVQSVTVETDATTGDTTVLVTYSYMDETGATQEQTVRLSVATAEGLLLVTTTTTTDPVTGETTTVTTANDGVAGTEVTIDPATVIADTTTEEDQHPVGSALAGFELFNVDYDTIMTMHEEGFGFGVIAQALWMTTHLDGDTVTFQDILRAKASGELGAIQLTNDDGTITTASNWGQFRKAVMNLGDDDKKSAKENLGLVMSGRAENESTSDTTQITEQNGKDKGQGQGAENRNDKGKSNKNKGKGRNK